MARASRLTLAKPAVRPSLKARLMLSGPAGAGKTYTALDIAAVLGTTTLVIDTEKESALTYADEFEFTHLPWQEPYDPRELAAVLTEADAAHDVIIVDSLSHFWGGAGGTLDIADGKFGGWKTARPAQQDAVAALLGCRAHVIVCVRSKMEHVQELDPKSGKQVVRKLGMAPQQDSTLEYELNLACEIDIDHRIAVSKSRSTAVPVGRTFAPGHARDMAKDYAAWLASGEPYAPVQLRGDIETARAGLPQEAKRSLWEEWKAQALPVPDLLTISQAETALRLLKEAGADV